MQRLVGWPLKKPPTKLEANDNIVDFAPSLEEADAILAKTAAPVGCENGLELAAA